MSSNAKQRNAASATAALTVFLTVLSLCFSARGDTTNAILAWDSLDGAALYTLYWGTSPGVYPSYASCLAWETNLTINNLSLDTFYYFAVSATQPDGSQSAHSPPVPFVSLSGGLNFEAATNGAVTDVVSWNPVAGAASYTLYWGPSSGVYPFSAKCPSSRTNLAAAVSYGQTFYFAISATDASGNQSLPSPEYTYVLQRPSDPPQPPPTNAYFLSWSEPAPINYGTPLGTNQLNAFGSLPGVVVYDPPAGTVLNAGINTLTAFFVPDDLLDYNIISNSVTISVSPAPLTITVGSATRSYTQSNPSFTSTIIGLTNGDNIGVVLSCSAGPSSPPGIYPIVPSLIDPYGRQVNYSIEVAYGALTVSPLNPQVNWSASAAITYGTPLDTNQLDATADVPGSFAYYPGPGAIVDSGTNTLTAVFTPSDSMDFAIITNTITLVVAPAPLTVIASNAAAAFGQIPAFTGAVSGLVNGDNIALSYDCAATASSPTGTYPITPALVDPSHLQTNYSVTLIGGTLTVGQSIPQITWTNPAPITYGVALNSNQLNAIADVPGAFSYNPPYGTVLDSGTNALTLTFNPADPRDYQSVNKTVSVYVAPASLTVTAADATQVYGQAAPAFMGTIEGLTNNDYVTAGYNCGATSASPVGSYPIVPTLADPFFELTNYTVRIVPGMLTVVPGPAQVLWPALKPVVYGTPLSSGQLVAVANVPGTFSYNPAPGTILESGTNQLSATFMPNDSVDYTNSVATTLLIVQPAPLIVKPDSFTRKFNAPNPVFTGFLAGLTNGDNISATFACAATQSSPPGSYAITATLVDSDSRASNYIVSILQGELTIVKPLQQQTWTGAAAGGYASSSGSDSGTVTIATNASSIFNPGGRGSGLSAGGAPVPISLNARTSGSGLVLTWNDPWGVFQLQTASDLPGAFADVPGATSPYTNSTSDARRFFRLIAR